jgi:hypothetical protein
MGFPNLRKKAVNMLGYILLFYQPFSPTISSVSNMQEQYALWSISYINIIHAINKYTLCQKPAPCVK